MALRAVPSLPTLPGFTAWPENTDTHTHIYIKLNIFVRRDAGALM